MTTTTPHTISSLANIGAAAAMKLDDGPNGGSCAFATDHDEYALDRKYREAFVKAILDAIGYKFPVDPEREAFDVWVTGQGLEAANFSEFLFLAFKAGREELRKALKTDEKEPLRPENDGWIDWPGGECPVDKFTKVEVRYRGIDDNDTLQAGNFRWSHINNQSDIVAYKIVTP